MMQHPSTLRFPALARAASAWLRGRASQGALTLLVLCMGVPLSARADMALVVSSHERASELTQALELSLRGYGVLTAYRPMGDARSPLERAAQAQRVARNASARVAFWVEPGPPARVRAVGAAERDERIVEAPLPTTLEQIDARAFAQIGASVILEVLGMARRNLPTARSAEYIVPMPPWSLPSAQAWLRVAPPKSYRVRRPRRPGAWLRRTRVCRPVVHA